MLATTPEGDGAVKVQEPFDWFRACVVLVAELEGERTQQAMAALRASGRYNL